MNKSSGPRRIGRRPFLKRSGIAVAGLAGMELARPKRAAAQAPVHAVAVRSCKRYDRELVHDTIGTMLEDLGGLPSLINGRAVAVKINGTGTGKAHHSIHSKMAHSTHPEVVYAACQHFLEAGATRINIMESWPSLSSGNTMARQMGFNISEFESLGDGSQVRFYRTGNKEVDEPNPATGYDAYSLIDVASGPGSGAPYLFDSFYVNRLWTPPKADVVVSIAKLKGHELAGATLSMKNMFGCLPNSIYGNDSKNVRPNENGKSGRSDSCHFGRWNGTVPLLGEIEGAEVPPFGPTRMPSLIADLVRALPIDLAIIDGITGTQGAWGPTERTSSTTPGVLVAGYNCVCTDSVCVGIMGHDPQAPPETGLFISGLNHIDMAAATGLGSNDLSEIPILGDPISKVRYDYYPHVNIADENPAYL